MRGAAGPVPIDYGVAHYGLSFAVVGCGTAAIGASQHAQSFASVAHADPSCDAILQTLLGYGLDTTIPPHNFLEIANLEVTIRAGY
jgi:hypothetical protein